MANAASYSDAATRYRPARNAALPASFRRVASANAEFEPSGVFAFESPSGRVVAGPSLDASMRASAWTLEPSGERGGRTARRTGRDDADSRPGEAATREGDGADDDAVANPGNAPDDAGGGAAPETFPPPPFVPVRCFLAEDRIFSFEGVFEDVFFEDVRADAPTWNAGADAAAASKKTDAADEGVAAAGGGGVNVNVNAPAPAFEDGVGDDIGDGVGDGVGDGRASVGASVPVLLPAPRPADVERLADAPLARRWFPANLDGDFPALNDKFSIPRSIVAVVSDVVVVSDFVVVVSDVVVDPNAGETGAVTPARNVAEKGVVV